MLILSKEVYIFKERFLALQFLIAGTVFIAGTAFLILKFGYLPPLVPLWYTLPWGVAQLADRSILAVLPLLLLLSFFTNLLLTEMFLRRREKILAQLFTLLNLMITLLLGFSLYRVVSLVSAPGTVPALLEERFIFPLILAFIFSFFLTFPTLSLAKKWGLIDNPETHNHPGMLLSKPTPRAGNLPAFLALILTTFLFVPPSSTFYGVLLAGGLMTVVGLIDDKYDLNPYIRLLSQIAAFTIVVLAGVHITYIGNPLDGIIPLDWTDLKFQFFGLRHFYLPGDLLTVLWGAALMNMLSWSNGVDGQFPGIVFITAIVIGILGERIILGNPDQLYAVIFSFIAAGAILGTLPFTWHPSKMLYGFGATAFGLVLAALAILSIAKISVTILILSVPTLDAIFAVVRRIRRGQSPVWGDRGHLHHKLLDLGWSQRRVAVFYWVITGFLGLIALYSSEKDLPLSLLTGGTVAALILILANLDETQFSSLIKLRKKN
ncbi:MAG: MraY family glycosyltransferase [Patescibacteria group bacterium]